MFLFDFSIPILPKVVILHPIKEVAMGNQIAFIACLAITFGVFLFTAFRLYRYYKLTQPYHFGHLGKRIMVTIKVAMFQSKIFRRPVIGFLHALVFWGFCVIAIGSIEMVIDGVSGSDRVFSSLGWVYQVITASGDVFALVVLPSILVVLVRRVFRHSRRCES